MAIRLPWRDFRNDRRPQDRAVLKNRFSAHACTLSRLALWIGGRFSLFWHGPCIEADSERQGSEAWPDQRISCGDKK
jgi:hypothetical protein